MSKLAIDGGVPVRERRLPYGRQWITQRDVDAVVATLQSDWLTTGPKVDEFEKALASKAGTAHAVVVSSGTAALHAAAHAAGVGKGDEVIVPAITFAATSNCALYEGATPIFADVDPNTLLIDPESVAARMTARTKAIIAVDFGGQACDYARLRQLASPAGITVIADACHALGGRAGGRPIGSLADLSTFSFHPVKHAATGEGGAITTGSDAFAQRMRVFRNHGITSDHRTREKHGTWIYDMVELGMNYRLSDIQCALGLTQLERLDRNVARRQEIAARYDAAFADGDTVRPLRRCEGTDHAFHLYVVRFKLAKLRVDRDAIMAALRAEGIGVNLHYRPVYLHPYYRTLGYQPGLCPKAEQVFTEIVTLPLFPTMDDRDVDDVIDAVRKVTDHYRCSLVNQ
ncbi:MAG: UDP-4-amino-4,6-dideoxy-N-acetyl-beta-L-altrosamine transaminase [Vicinamibacterales bacterium]